MPLIKHVTVNKREIAKKPKPDYDKNEHRRNNYKNPET